MLLAGGSGTRFWPESRIVRPKQLLRIIGERTMIQATADRVAPLIPFERMMVVCGFAHKEEIRFQLGSIPQRMIVVEPQGLNTAPCIALGTYKLANQDPEAVITVLPADHTIGKEAEFLSLMDIAHRVAMEGEWLITFGILPMSPETGYGYIQYSDVAKTVDSQPLFRVKRFVEKPDLQKATEYIAQGNYLWNSGMFVWQAKTIIRAFETYLPRLAHAMEKVVPHFDTPREAQAVLDAYETISSVSIDYGIMEKASNVLVMPADVEWNDVGAWNSLEKIWEKDQDGNAFRGHLISLQSGSCIVSSMKKLTALIGVEDLIVVDTADALLVCRKDRAQEVKNLQELLKIQGYQELL